MFYTSILETQVMKQTILLLLTLVALKVSAQEIGGRVWDSKKEPVWPADVTITWAGRLIDVTCTDYDGFYVFKPLQPGKYDVTVQYSGCDTATVTDIIVAEIGSRTTQNFNLERAQGAARHTVSVYKRQLMANAPGPSASGGNTPDIQITDIVSENPRIYQTPRERTTPMTGCRNSGTIYIIDGIQVQPVAMVTLSEPFADDYKPASTTSFKLNRAQIKTLPATDIRDMVSLSPGAYQPQRGAEPSLCGAVDYSTLYVIDGVQIAR